MNDSVFSPGDIVYIHSCGGRTDGNGEWFDLIGCYCEVSHSFKDSSGAMLIYVWDTKKTSCWAYATWDLELVAD
jgi:hypothetical protein